MVIEVFGIEIIGENVEGKFDNNLYVFMLNVNKLVVFNV